MTVPAQRRVPPGAAFSAAAFNYGNARVRVQLNWPDGTLRAGILPDGGAMALVNADGSIYVKVGWWRGVRGQLVVRGRRLDAHALPLRADVGTVASYGDVGFRAERDHVPDRRLLASRRQRRARERGLRGRGYEADVFLARRSSAYSSRRRPARGLPSPVGRKPADS